MPKLIFLFMLPSKNPLPIHIRFFFILYLYTNQDFKRKRTKQCIKINQIIFFILLLFKFRIKFISKLERARFSPPCGLSLSFNLFVF